MTDYSWTGVTGRGDTPRETALAVAADPDWRFSSDPVGGISHAAVAGAGAYIGLSYGPVGAGESMSQARYWLEVGTRLALLAGRPRGAVLDGLAATLGEPLTS